MFTQGEGGRPAQTFIAQLPFVVGMDPQDGGVGLPPLTAPNILWEPGATATGAGDQR